MKKNFYILILLTISSWSYSQDYVPLFTFDFNTADQDASLVKIGSAACHPGISNGYYQMTTADASKDIVIRDTTNLPAGKVVYLKSELHVKFNPFTDTGSDFKVRFFGPDGFIEVVLNSFYDIRVYHGNSVTGVSKDLAPNSRVDIADDQLLKMLITYDGEEDTIEIKYGTPAGWETLYSGEGNGGSFGNFYSDFVDLLMFKWGAGDNATSFIDYWAMEAYVDTNAVSYTVKFDSDGGSPVNQIVTDGGKKITQPTDPVKPGFIFQGWYLEDNLFDFETPITNNITLTARWKLDGKPDFTDNFDVLDPKWIALGNASNYHGISSGYYFIESVTPNENIPLRHYIGKTDDKVLGFTAEVDVLFSQLTLTGTDFKWHLEGPNGVLEFVLNSFYDLRAYHQNNTASLSGNIVENTPLPYTDGQTLKLMIVYDAVADNVVLKYKIDDENETVLYTGKGQGDGLGDFYTKYTELNLYKWGDGSNCIAAIDYAAFNCTYEGTAINTIAASVLKAYPNPATTFVNVDGLAEGTVISVYNLDGKMMFAAKAQKQTTRLNVNDLAPGIYLIKSNDNNGIKISRFIKQ
jgi:uncharacterized repeat protein (TIGR02543 family)